MSQGRSPAAPARLALFEEGRHAFFEVLGLTNARILLERALNPQIELLIYILRQEFLGRTQRTRTVLHQHRRKLVCSRQKTFGLDDLIHQPQPVGLVGSENAAAEQEIAREFLANLPYQ